MDIELASAEDYTQINIAIHSLFELNSLIFNNLLQRLSKICAVEVSTEPKRIIYAKFVTSINSDYLKFSEFQLFRKVFGLVCIGEISNEENSILLTDVEKTKNLYQQYKCFKEKYHDFLIASCCILFGQKESSFNFEDKNVIYLSSVEDSKKFEGVIHDLIHKIFFVLESKSFEKIDALSCPILPEEEKYFVGTEVVKGKAFKRKCLGRKRKQLGDYFLLTNLPELAINAYQSAIEYLGQYDDFLWLAAAYEGWCCSALLIKYKEKLEKLKKKNPLRSHSSFSHKTFTIDFNATLPDNIQTNDNDQISLLSLTHVLSDEDKTSINIDLNRSNSDKKKLFDTSSLNFFEKNKTKSRTLAYSYSANSLFLTKTDEICDFNSKQKAITANDILIKFRLALENYGKYSFCSIIECECIVRNAFALIFQRTFIETEAFIHEKMAKFLDDNFTLFDNKVKARICLICAGICKKIKFERKAAFYLRLAVLFQLNVANENVMIESKEYQAIYPILYQSLGGYGVLDAEKINFINYVNLKSNNFFNNFDVIPKFFNSTKNIPFSIQIRAVYEVFISASRANYIDAAIRHLCFILQNYYDSITKEEALVLIDELNKLVVIYNKIHILSEPIYLADSKITLPPLEFNRFPTFSNFKLCSLPPYLAPNVVDSCNLNSKVFIYSPFQNRDKIETIYWVVNCACEVSLCVQNPLPIELTIKNLKLLTEGCEFDTIPVRLNLSPYNSDSNSNSSSTIKLLGVPRSSGILTITGYSCEVLGVCSVCYFKKNDLNKQSNSENFKVRILEDLPLLSLETSLKTTSNINKNASLLAEATVFTGQKFNHSIYLHNTSEKIAIKHVTIKLNQPKVCGGPSLIKILHPLDVFILKPGEKRQIDLEIFGIDPSANTASSKRENLSDFVGEEHCVYVKRHNYLNCDRIKENMDSSSAKSLKDESLNLLNEIKKSENELQIFPELEENTNGHDLIPYIGRLLSAEFVFTYTANITGVDGEYYERVAKLQLAIAIVPAINVSNWHILAGDSLTTRYVVVDVANLTDFDAELTYEKNRLIWVQPKEVCRVPLLCPCCTEIESSAFFTATQQASHMMQMREVENLRKTLEKHVSQYLDIRWSIPNLKLYGYVPVGSLLSSVSFLKQLVIPAISMSITINGFSYVSEDDYMVGMGELIKIEIIILVSTKTAKLLDKQMIHGNVTLFCYQDLQNGMSQKLNCSENLVICGPSKIPFSYDAFQLLESSNKFCEMKMFKCEFSIFFRYEGIHKLKPKLLILSKSIPLSDENIFIPSASFNVITR